MTKVVAHASYYYNYGAWFKFQKWDGYVTGYNDGFVWFEQKEAESIHSWFGNVEVQIDRGIKVEDQENIVVYYPEMIGDKLLYGIEKQYFNI